ncbi:MAG: hypothetical protein ACRCZ2_03045 [Fusobacteriaceae bacterium]
MLKKLLTIFYLNLDIKEVARDSAINSVDKILYKIKMEDIDKMRLDACLCGEFLSNEVSYIIDVRICGGRNTRIPHHRTKISVKD